jgi:Spy/CpxP family protein refolding chaperone
VGIVAGMIALAATPALAQGQAQGEGQGHERNHAQGARHGHDPEKKIERLRESLDLTDSQVTEVRAIFAEEAEKRRDLRESEDQEGLRVLRQETHDRLVAVLDENQKEKLEGLKERRGEGHREREGGGRHPERHGAES